MAKRGPEVVFDEVSDVPDEIVIVDDLPNDSLAEIQTKQITVHDNG